MCINNNYINKITLSNFRNYKQFELQCSELPVVILGKNGTGKTNILEAISLLSPGRGMRSAQLQDIGYYRNTNWALNANVVNNGDIYNIGVGLNKNSKIIKIDHKTQSRQTELTKIINIIWLTPQMNTIFLGSRKNRLHFFDRIVFSFDADHAQNVSMYENAKRERNKLLIDKIADDCWLSTLESKMVKAGVKIAKARMKVMNYLQRHIDDTTFNYIEITMDGEVEKLVTDIKEDCGAFFLNKLKETRKIDILSKRTSYGVHKSDFNAWSKRKKLSAMLSSTGEQKLIMLAIILAAIKKDTILLLDDIVSHLDNKNRSMLFSSILEKKCQAWMTDTNLDNFNEIKNHTQMFCVENLLLKKTVNL